MKTSNHSFPLILFLFAWHSCIAALGQGATIDPTFNVTLAAGGGEVQGAAILPDGKIIVAGRFGAVNGVPRPGIARLHADGRLDVGFFQNGTSLGLLEFQSDRGILLVPMKNGDVILSVSTRPFSESARSTIYRLNPSGEIAFAFAFPPEVSCDVSAMAALDDGRILVGGRLPGIGIWAERGIVRLLPDGAVDTSLNPRTEFGGSGGWEISALVIQKNGQILVGGNFNQFNGVRRAALVRLNPDAQLEESFNPTIGPGDGGSSAWVSSVSIQENGKVLIAGRFRTVNDQARPGVARLNADGSLDEAFSPKIQQDSAPDWALLQGDGRIVIGGFIRRSPNDARVSVARLDPDGGIDAAYLFSWIITPVSDVVPPRLVTAALLQLDGRLILAGPFRLTDSSEPLTFGRWGLDDGIVRLEADGRVDVSFSPIIGWIGEVRTAVREPGGHFVIGGSFVQVNGVPRTSLARLRADGSLDLSFNPLFAPYRSVSDMRVARGSSGRKIPCRERLRIYVHDH